MVARSAIGGIKSSVGFATIPRVAVTVNIAQGTIAAHSVPTRRRGTRDKTAVVVARPAVFGIVESICFTTVVGIIIAIRPIHTAQRRSALAVRAAHLVLTV